MTLDIRFQSISAPLIESGAMSPPEEKKNNESSNRSTWKSLLASDELVSNVVFKYSLLSEATNPYPSRDPKHEFSAAIALKEVREKLEQFIKGQQKDLSARMDLRYSILRAIEAKTWVYFKKPSDGKSSPVVLDPVDENIITKVVVQWAKVIDFAAYANAHFIINKDFYQAKGWHWDPDKEAQNPIIQLIRKKAIEAEEMAAKLEYEAIEKEKEKNLPLRLLLDEIFPTEQLSS